MFLRTFEIAVTHFILNMAAYVANPLMRYSNVLLAEQFNFSGTSVFTADEPSEIWQHLQSTIELMKEGKSHTKKFLNQATQLLKNNPDSQVGLFLTAFWALSNGEQQETLFKKCMRNMDRRSELWRLLMAQKEQESSKPKALTNDHFDK